VVLGFTITLSQRHGIVQQNGMGRWGDGNGGGIATAWVEIGSDTVDREGGGLDGFSEYSNLPCSVASE